MNKSRVFSVSMSPELFDQLENAANDASSSRSEIMRLSFEGYCESAPDLAIAKKILKKSSFHDVSPWNLQDGKTNRGLKILIHKRAYGDLYGLGKKIEQEVIGFFKENKADGSLLHKGDIKTIDNGLIFICYRINLIKVYCHFSRGQLIILSVSS
jgi:predicted DNA-binding protein